MKKRGKVTELFGCHVWEHERKTAQALASQGWIVEFIPPNQHQFIRIPDVLINGQAWEIKSPKTDKLNQIKNNLRKARKQSSRIIIDSQRIKKIPDKIIQAYLVDYVQKRQQIKGLIFVNRRREVIILR